MTAEYFVVACAAGVTDEALATRQASDPGFDWTVPSAYNLKPMAPIGTRRATEMREAAWFLADLDLPYDVSVATATSQNRIGDLGLELEGTEARGSAALALTALRGDP